MAEELQDAANRMLGSMAEVIRESMRRETDIMEYMKLTRRRGHIEPFHPEYLKERAEFAENFFALQQEGLDKGFLEYAEDGVVESPDHGVWVFDETEAEHTERMRQEFPAGTTITFQVKRRDES